MFRFIKFIIATLSWICVILVLNKSATTGIFIVDYAITILLMVFSFGVLTINKIDLK